MNVEGTRQNASVTSEEGGPILRQLNLGGTSQGDATVYQKHRALLTRKWMYRV